MPRNMSFALTTDQIRNKTKTVTRRFGWWFLVPDDVVMACEKCMGLAKGEKIVRLAPIAIISSEGEPLSAITEEDMALEGLPWMSPEEYIAMMIAHNKKVTPSTLTNRIEFKYL